MTHPNVHLAVQMYTECTVFTHLVIYNQSYNLDLFQNLGFGGHIKIKGKIRKLKTKLTKFLIFKGEKWIRSLPPQDIQNFPGGQIGLKKIVIYPP